MPSDGEGGDIKKCIEKDLEHIPFVMRTLGEVTEPVIGDESLLIPHGTDLSEVSD